MATGFRREQGAVAIKAVSCELNADRLSNTCHNTVCPGGLRHRMDSIFPEAGNSARQIYIYHCVVLFSSDLALYMSLPGGNAVKKEKKCRCVKWWLWLRN